MADVAMRKVKEECPDCHGTGLYSGICEAKGEAVICCGCDGKGWRWHHYRKFDGRKKKKGVKTIRPARGTLIATGVGEAAKNMTYAEFENNFPVKAR